MKKMLTALVAGLALADFGGVLVEAEAFARCGGWVVDQQFMDQMGSPYLLAHGIGTPVEDAMTEVDLGPLNAEEVFVWVRTRDWVAPHGAGRFTVKALGEAGEILWTSPELGIGTADWHWAKVGAFRPRASKITLVLHDLTGFEGRVDAVFFGRSAEFPPETWTARRRLLGLGAPETREFDFVVVGGGFAGLCAAVTAAREGLRVALVQDRPVFGGNGSSEVRVPVVGGIGQPPFPHNGDVLRELLAFVDRTQRPAWGDRWKIKDEDLGRFLASVKGLALYPSTRAVAVEKSADGAIGAVVGRNVITGRETRFVAKFVLDATGDAAVAVAAGATCRIAPEMRSETGEALAPDGVRRGGGYGSSLQWFAQDVAEPVPFPSCPWALPVEKPEDAFLGQEAQWLPSGGWNWETAFWEDNVRDGEKIRDRLFRAIYGTWDFTKNKREDKARFVQSKIYWLGYVLGKRAARRVIGDYVLTETDLVSGVPHPDGVVTTDWYVDLHFPHPAIEPKFGIETFRATAYDARDPADRVDTNRFVGGRVEIKPYAIPFRCLYSKDVPNLFLAGKDISATYVAMGSHRVMATGGAMGTVVARAAALCVRDRVRPRDLSTGDGLLKLKRLLAQPIGSRDNAL